MVGIEGFVNTRDRCECHETGIVAASRDLDSLCNKGAVQPGERNDVANGAERHQIEPTHQIGLRAVSGIPACPAQRAIYRDDQ